MGKSHFEGQHKKADFALVISHIFHVIFTNNKRYILFPALISLSFKEEWMEYIGLSEDPITIREHRMLLNKYTLLK